MSWTDIGFNDNLSMGTISDGSQVDPVAFEQVTQNISASKLSGLMQSQDGKLKMDLDQNSFIVSDGVIERIRLGKLADGTYGMLIQDVNGNKLMQIGDTNYIQSPSGTLLLDIDAEQFLVKDDGGIPILLLGKQVGGF